MVDCGRWSQEGRGNAEQVGFRYRAVSRLLPAGGGSMRHVRNTDEKTEVCRCPSLLQGRTLYAVGCVRHVTEGPWCHRKHARRKQDYCQGHPALSGSNRAAGVAGANGRQQEDRLLASSLLFMTSSCSRCSGVCGLSHEPKLGCGQRPLKVLRFRRTMPRAPVRRGSDGSGIPLVALRKGLLDERTDWLDRRRRGNLRAEHGQSKGFIKGVCRRRSCSIRRPEYWHKPRLR